MAYAFNDDKSKFELYNQDEYIVYDSGYISDSSNHTFQITNENISANNCHILSAKIYDRQSGMPVVKVTEVEPYIQNGSITYTDDLAGRTRKLRVMYKIV